MAFTLKWTICWQVVKAESHTYSSHIYVFGVTEAVSKPSLVFASWCLNCCPTTSCSICMVRNYLVNVMFAKRLQRNSAINTNTVIVQCLLFIWKLSSLGGSIAQRGSDNKGRLSVSHRTPAAPAGQSGTHSLPIYSCTQRAPFRVGGLKHLL